MLLLAFIATIAMNLNVSLNRNFRTHKMATKDVGRAGWLAGWLAHRMTTSMRLQSFLLTLGNFFFAVIFLTNSIFVPAIRPSRSPAISLKSVRLY